MSELKIFSYPKNPRVEKALIAAEYYGVKIETTPNFKMGVDNKTDEFKKMNPNGKVPVLKTPEGALFESGAIARYVGRLGDKSLYGKNNFEQGQVDQWIDWCTWHVELPAMAWLYPIMGFVPNNNNRTKKAKGDVRNALAILNQHLKTRTFLVGERVSLADIVLACTLKSLYTTVLAPGFRNSFVNTNRWFMTCINQPNFAKVLGKVELATKMAVAPAAKKEQKKQQPKKKQQQQKKKQNNNNNNNNNQKKKVDEREQFCKKWAKKLPKSKFNLEEWKRYYSNNKDTKGVAMPWFWKNFDEKAFSIYFARYRYPEEQTSQLGAVNLAGGFTQRMQNRKVNKFGFGNLLVLGSGPFELQGAYVFAGDCVPPYLEDVPDYPSFEFTKADLSDQKQKDKVGDYWAWEGDFGGLAFDGWSAKTLK